MSALDEFLNSLKIIQSDPKMYELIHFNDIEIKNAYEKKRCNGENYIIMTTLDLQHIYQH